MQKIQLPNFISEDNFEEFKRLSEDFLRGIDGSKLLLELADEDFTKARWHPGGFYVFYLSPTEERYKGQLRLHVWPNKINRAFTDVHQHPWHLASLVLAGEYQEQTAMLLENNKGTYSLFNPGQSKEDPNIFNPVDLGKVDFSFSKPHIYKTNDMHSVAKGQYHFTAFSGFAITLALMGTSSIDCYCAHHEEGNKTDKPIDLKSQLLNFL